jgi:hypothetical protein
MKGKNNSWDNTDCSKKMNFICRGIKRENIKESQVFEKKMGFTFHSKLLTWNEARK